MPRVSYIKVCGVEECTTDHYAKGFCKPHYMIEFRKKISPDMPAKPKKEDVFDYEDFWQFVKKELDIG